MEAGLGFEHLAHLDAIELLVALRAGAPDGGAARGIQQAKLDADGIGDFAHDAAERIDFADEVALGHAADGRIAAHLRDEVHVHGDERGFQAHARRGHGCFAAGVTGAHDDHVVLFGERHPILFYGSAGVAIRESMQIRLGSRLPMIVQFSIMSAFPGPRMIEVSRPSMSTCMCGNPVDTIGELLLPLWCAADARTGSYRIGGGD